MLRGVGWLVCCVLIGLQFGCLAGPAIVVPGVEDFSAFQQFEFRYQPGSCAPLDTVYRGEIEKEPGDTYFVRLWTLADADSDPSCADASADACCVQELVARELTPAETARLLEIFAATDVADVIYSSMCVFPAVIQYCRWDDVELNDLITCVDGPYRVVTGSQADKIRAFLEELASQPAN